MKKAGFLSKIAMATSASLAFTFTLSFADTIHMKDGSKIEDAAITEIGDSDVKYKIGKRTVIYIAKKSDIATIVYDDGTKEEFASKSNIKLDDDKDEELPQPKKVMKKQKQEEVEETEETEKRIRFGVRGNLGTAQISPNAWKYDSETIEIDGGSCYGIGAFALIPFKSIYFVPEVSIERREPIDYNGFKMVEMAIDIPMHFRFRYREENLVYLGIGPFLGFVLSSQYEYDSTTENNENRSKADFGIAMEIGFRISDNFSIDIRGLGSFSSIGFTEFMESEGVLLEGPSTLVQVQIGLNYLF